MRTSDICHLKSWLIAVANDLESANTLEKLENCLKAQRLLWNSLHDYFSPGRQNDLEIFHYSDFVLGILQDHTFPDDRYISALAGINLRASALLGARCPCRNELGRCLCLIVDEHGARGKRPMERQGAQG
ncbi:hypothetical protein [Telmatospirillum sp.]|uniref:hypothetical protein n=1 Tax=Telmatospirillum sp. TaxID=2079197 RepID=UPI00284EF7DD|nr:hypothetical protein [Telmatospirillum sp.]MDR3439442.1 hypothetical protein [Telmatospirillum sp.]